MSRYHEPRKIYTQESKDNFEPIVTAGYGGGVEGFFLVIRIVLWMAFVLCIPFLFIAFMETISPFIFIFISLSVVELISRIFGWHRFNRHWIDY
jgi:cellulose synthase/poly-beta-1,6-N-acetylglucosamine synthase-like glycosyltransferase